MLKNNINKKHTHSTEELVTKITLDSLKKNTNGITKYPILEFDERALRLLCTGIRETLKYSKVRPAGSQTYEKLKRIFDVIISGTALAILFIPMSATALAIYMDDKGNPIFSQVRLTENGRPFKMYKFRSMCVDAEKKFSQVQKLNETDGIAFKNENDPRITRIGRFIRKTSIDELPQLWNVLKGDMSIIGPRPPLPREAVLYTPHQMERLLVKGGLACTSQCEGRSNVPFDEWVESDIRYIRKRSLKTDFNLILRMILVVITGKGAE